MVVAELAEDEVAFVLLADVDEACVLGEDLVVCVAVLKSGRLVRPLTELARSNTSRPAAAVLTRIWERILLSCVSSL